MAALSPDWNDSRRGTLVTMAGFTAHPGYMKLILWVILAGLADNFIEAMVRPKVIPIKALNESY